MKKLFTFLLLACFVSGVTLAQVTFGPKFGVNFSDYHQDVKDSDDKTDFVYKVGPAVGFAVNIPLNDFLTLQPSLSFSTKGASFDTKKWTDYDQVTAVDGYQRIRVGYFELPVNLAAGLDVGSGQLQLFLGPYIGVGISGWIISDYTITYTDGSSDTEDDNMEIIFKDKLKKEDFKDNAGYMKPIDYGLNFGFGLQFDPVLINVGYSLGLQNLSTEVEDPDPDFYNDDKIYNRMFFISFAILLENQ
ncbi:MAG: PorT family protein [Bacteroidales bacterium]|nr:PorT family protein [Bacteroidales bacterium]